MGLRTVVGSIVSFLVRWLLRIGRTLLAVATLAGYALVWLTLRQPDVTVRSRVMRVLYLATAAVSVLLAVLVLLGAYRGVAAALGGLVPSLPSRGGSGNTGGSTLSAPDIGTSEPVDGRDDSDDEGSRFGSSDDGDGGEGSILGPHN